MSQAFNEDTGDERATPPTRAERDSVPAKAGVTSYGRRTVDDVAFELVVTSAGIADEAPCDGFYVSGPECLEPAHWARVCSGCRGTIFSCHAHRRSWDDWVVKPPTGGRCTSCLTSLAVPIDWVTV